MKRNPPVVLSDGEEVRGLDVINLPGYYTTSHGRILSELGASNQFVKHSDTLHEIRGGMASNGYRMVSIRHEDGKYRTRCVHELVALVFLGQPPAWHQEYRHKDNNKENCSVGNLCFGTCADNAKDRKAAGTHRVGSQMNNAKLNETIVRWMRRRVAEGFSVTQIARDIGISQSTASLAVLGKTWTHVKEETEEA